MRDAAGNTALHKAAECSQPTACRFLIANGADPLIKNCEGRVPADLATASVAKVIMEEPIKPNADIESQLLEAAKNGDLDTVKVRGEREKEREREGGRRKRGDCHIIPSFMQHLCTPQNVNTRDIRGRFSTPLHFAAGFNRVSTVEYLLQNGADVHARDKG